MGKADLVSIGRRALLAAPLLVGAGLMSVATSTSAGALELPPISVPPVSVGPVVVPPVQTPPVVVPVPSTVAVGPLVVTAPEVTTDDGGLHVRVPLPAEEGTSPETVGIDLGGGEAPVSPPIPPTAGPISVERPAARAPGATDTDGGRRQASAQGHGAGGVAHAQPDAAGRSNDAVQSQVVNADPAGAHGSLANEGHGGLRSLLATAAHSKVTWLLLIGLALVARFVATWAWRDALTATSQRRSRGRSATV